MSQPPTPMEVELAPRGRNKRSASDDLSLTTPSTPLSILRHHVHRKRNIAAPIWGLDIPIAITAAATTTTTTTTTAPNHGNGNNSSSSSTTNNGNDNGNGSSAPQPPPRFNIYKALLRHPNLFFQFALRLPYRSIVNLYAIDKEFHYRLNKFSVGLLHDYARYHAPLASHIFSWALYPELCISDPMLRPMDGRTWLARDVPSFRWVGMVMRREAVVRDIVTQMGLAGQRVPAGTLGSVMKFWCVMETRRTRKRQAFLQDTSIWSAVDLRNIQLWWVKLDMVFSDVVLGNGVAELGHLLLAQRSLRTLWMVLMGTLVLDYDLLTDMAVRTYLPEDLDTDALDWLDDETENVVPEEWGLLCREGWESGGAKMECAIDMLLDESIRRGLHLQQYYLDFVLYGFVDLETGKNMPVPTLWARDKKITVPREGWPGKETREQLIEGLNKRYLAIEDGEAMDTSE